MNQAEREEFGAYLKGLRTAKGITQRKAGELAGISCPYLTQLERGQRNPPSRDLLIRLAGAYAINEDRLLLRAGYVGINNPIAITNEQIEWAFDCILRDPAYTFGTRLRGREMTVEAKKFIVEMYEQSTGRKLLTVPMSLDDMLEGIIDGEKNQET